MHPSDKDRVATQKTTVAGLLQQQKIGKSDGEWRKSAGQATSHPRRHLLEALSQKKAANVIVDPYHALFIPVIGKKV